MHTGQTAKEEQQTLFTFPPSDAPSWVSSSKAFTDTWGRLFKYGFLATFGGLIHAVGVLEGMFTTFSRETEDAILRLLSAISINAQRLLESLADADDEMRRLWETIDLVLA